MWKLKSNLISFISSHNGVTDSSFTFLPQVPGKPDSYEMATLEIGQKTAQDSVPWEKGSKQELCDCLGLPPGELLRQHREGEIQKESAGLPEAETEFRAQGGQRSWMGLNVWGGNIGEEGTAQRAVRGPLRPLVRVLICTFGEELSEISRWKNSWSSHKAENGSYSH